MKLTVLALSLLLSTSALAQSHSGPVDASDARGSVVNSHSSDGNQSAAAHAGQSSSITVAGDDSGDTLFAASFPYFSQRGDCSGSEGSAQGGAAGAFFGFSFGSGNATDCEIRNNLAVLSELVFTGMLTESEARYLARSAILQLEGFKGHEYVTERNGRVTVTTIRRKAEERRLNVLERRELNR